MDAPLVGRTLGHFHVTEAIGAGGMGVVYKATDLQLRRTVALKVLPPELAIDPQRRQRLLGEARTASALNHPNIVTVYEIDSADGTDFIAMEYLEGRPLDRLIGAQGLPIGEALAYAAQIATALAAAHAQGVVHRDLKPANVIVSTQGQVKVVDFGLAKRLPGALLASEAPTETAGGRTAEGTVAGTAAYMSPEQAEGRPIDGRSDLFSLGVILFEMVTGRRPFQGESVAALLSAILRDEPPPARALRPALPAGLDVVLAKALAKRVDQRYASATEFRAEIEKLAGAHDTMTPAPRRSRWLVLAMPALVLVATGLVWLRARPHESPALRARLLSTFPGSHRAPGLSPDGKMVAFVDSARGVPQIWVKYLGEGEAVQITSGDLAAGRPRFSPRGAEIVFERRRGGIWSVPPLGGAPRRIVEAGTCPNFFPDGDRVVFDKGTELWTVRLDGSDARKVAGVQENFFSFYLKHCAAVSPDGRSLAYFQPERGTNGDFWIVPAEGGKPRRLTSDIAPGGSPVFSRDGRSVVFSSSRAGSRTLWRVPVAGGSPEPVTTGAGEDDEPDLSPDGRKLVYTNSRHSFALTLADADGSRRQLLEWRSQINGAVFSSDAKRLAFFAWTDEHEQIFVIDADGGGLQQITHGRGPSIMPRWSPDGASIYFFQEDPPAFCRVSASGGPVTELIPGWRWGAVIGAWLDPSGTRLAYTTMGMGTPLAARVRDLTSGREQDIHPAMVVGPWSPDGKLIAGHTSDAGILLCPVEGDPCRSLAQAGGQPRWSGDGRRLFLSRRGKRTFDDPTLQSLDVWSVGLDGTGERRVATLEPLHVLATPFDVSIHDEIAWVESRHGKQELWLAERDGP